MSIKVLCLRIVVLTFLLLFVSCENKKQRSAYIDVDNTVSTFDSSMSVPFKEEGGV